MTINWFSILLAVATVGVIIGIFLITYNVLLTGLEVFVRLGRKVLFMRSKAYMRRLGLVREEPWSANAELDVRRLVIVLAIPLLAIVVQDWLLTPMVAGLGILLLWWLNFAQRSRQGDQVNEDAEMVAMQVRAHLRTNHSLISALRSVQLPKGRLRHALDEVVLRLEMQESPEEAAKPLAALPGTETARLATLISKSAIITEDVQLSLLEDLEQESNRQKLLRSKMRQVLALVKGTIRLLQGAVALALLVTFVVPEWRMFFLQDISHRMTMMILVAAAAVASLYFEFEVYQLGKGEAF